MFARASAPPSSRSTTQTALLTSSDASRSASIAANRGPSRGDDVLHEARELALLEDPFEPVPRPVALGLLADDQEREPGGERGRRGERDRAELGACEAHGAGLDILHGLGDLLAERAEQVGPRLEPVLVEVVLRAAARAEEEVALEVGVVAERGRECVPVHAQRVAASSSRACASNLSAPGWPAESETIEPSRK